MIITQPYEMVFTVYSKSNCFKCEMLKEELKNRDIPFESVECDGYLRIDRNAFLRSIERLSGVEIKTFPIIFFDGKYLTYNETMTFINDNKHFKTL